jgi:hypothetical protein
VVFVLLRIEGSTDPQHPCETVNELKDGTKKIILKMRRRFVKKRKLILSMLAACGDGGRTD